MIAKLKRYLEKSRNRQIEILGSVSEVEWATIYHDAIRDLDFLAKLPMYPGRWAVGYPCFMLWCVF